MLLHMLHVPCLHISNQIYYSAMVLSSRAEVPNHRAVGRFKTGREKNKPKQNVKGSAADWVVETSCAFQSRLAPSYDYLLSGRLADPASCSDVVMFRF